MKEQNIQTHSFSNGLTLVAEPMAGVQSAAFSLLVPSGSIFDPPGKNGSAAILCDMITRGAGDRDSVELSNDLDNLGLQRSENVGGNHVSFSGAALAENLATALTVYGDILRRPHLPDEEFEPTRAGIEQSLRAAEDEPRQKIMVELRRRSFESPWGLPSDGCLDDLPSISIDTIREHYGRCFRPNGTILGIGGNFDFEEIKDVVGNVFGDWEAKDDPTFETGQGRPKIDNIQHDSAQTHIGISYEAVPFTDPDYYAAWAAVGVLSGGMSSRLFTEVREKRGLCYAISASLNSLPHAGRVLCYAGTKSERAQETLDVTLQELIRLGEDIDAEAGTGIQQSELDRCKARAKSSLVMQQESTFSRALSIARDWYFLGRVRTLAEVYDKIESLTVESVLDYAKQHPAGDFTILTIGPEPLEVNVAVS
ncbi:MAG: peptidase M16 [Planctomycetaceae bacterium]|nr:peptidase M16 [Planctomycetaceae bacterium]